MTDKDLLPVLPIKAPVALPHIEMRIEVGRSFSKNAVITSELSYENEILLVFQKEDMGEEGVPPTINDCYPIALLAKFDTKIKLPNSNFKIKFTPFARVQVNTLYVSNDCVYSNYHILDDIYGNVDDQQFFLSKINTQILEKGGAYFPTP